MVKVPEYEQSMALRPAYRQDVEVRATPEAFGADAGRGLVGLAKGVEHVADAMAAVRDIEDAARTKDALAGYSKWKRDRLYGENGFMTKEGRNAVDGYSGFEQEAEDKRKQFGQGLTPGAARMYENASKAELNSALNSSIQHTASQRKAWVNQASASRVSTFADDALTNYNKPDQVAKYIAAGQAEMRQMASLNGWDAAKLQAEEGDFISGVHTNVTKRILQFDPIAADKYMKANIDQISGKHQYELKSKLDVEVKDAQSKSHAAEWASRSAQSSPQQPGSATFNMIAGFEGFRESTYWDVNHHRVGYGSDTVTRADGSVAKTQQGMTVSRDEAGRDLTRRIGIYQRGIIDTVGPERWGALSSAAQAAVTSVAYNYGSLPFAVGNAIVTGGPAEIAAAIRGLAGHNSGVNASRRNKEADAAASGNAAGVGVGQNVNSAVRQAQDYFTNLESYLATIKDPDVQDRTRKRINAANEAQNKAREAGEKAAKSELWSYIDAGKTPDQVPMEIRQAAGMSAVSAAWGYMETVKKGRSIESDDTLLYDLRRYAAMKPNEFANIDLNDYRDRLSKETIKELTGLQTTALTDQRKAREEGLNLTNAFSQANQQLEAVGITATGKKGEAAQRENARIAAFQNALAAELDTFKKSNEGRTPTPIETRSMINKLLLPIVVKTPGMIWDTNENKRIFEAVTRSDGSTISPVKKISEIPENLRSGIAIDLARELGRKPSEIEIMARYRDIVSGR